MNVRVNVSYCVESTYFNKQIRLSNLNEDVNDSSIPDVKNLD